MLKTRIITAVFLLIGFVVLLTFLDVQNFSRVMLVVSTIAAWEWGRLCFKNDVKRSVIFTICTFLLMCALWRYFPFASLPLGIVVSGLWLVVMGVIVTGKISRVNSTIAVLLGLLFIPVCYSSLLLLRHGIGKIDGQFLVWSAFLTIWSADIGAYFMGKQFGKNKLAKDISPNKTWEGLWGGALLTTLIAIATGYYYFGLSVENITVWLLICISSGLISVVGDLFESHLKRQANEKDSGSILPGHGGVLDRVDGVLAAAPVFVCLTLFFFAN